MAKDQYSLPADDSCYSTLEAYKHYAADAIDDAFRAYWYRQYGERLGQWQQCCPELREQVSKQRPEKLDAEALRTVTFPEAIGSRENPCRKHLYFKETPAGQESRGKAWFKYREGFSNSYWEKQYAALADTLHACCVKKFDQCLHTVQEQYAARQATVPGAVELCTERFSPEHQKPAALPGASTPAKQQTPAEKSLEQSLQKLQETVAGLPDAPAPAENPCATSARQQERRQCDEKVTRLSRLYDTAVATLVEVREDCKGQAQKAAAAQEAALARERAVCAANLAARLRQPRGAPPGAACPPDHPRPRRAPSRLPPFRPGRGAPPSPWAGERRCSPASSSASPGIPAGGGACCRVWSRRSWRCFFISASPPCCRTRGGPISSSP